MTEAIIRWVCGATFAIGVIGYFFGRASTISATKTLEEASAYYTKTVADARAWRDQAVAEAKAIHAKATPRQSETTKGDQRT